MKKFIELHKFFVKESRTFVGVRDKKGKYHFKFKDLLYYPIAYVKFMYYSLR